jgi:hypothetical protein
MGSAVKTKPGEKTKAGRPADLTGEQPANWPVIRFRPEAFGDLMRLKGWGLKRFARAISATPAMVFAWRKRICMPQIGTLLRICNTLRLPLDYFFKTGETGEEDQATTAAKT